MSPTVGVWNGYKTIVWAVRCGDIAGSLTRRLQLQRVVFLLEVYGVCLVGDYGSHGAIIMADAGTLRLYLVEARVVLTKLKI